MNNFYSSSKDKCNGANKKIIMNHVLMRWNEDKSISHPSTCALYPAETVAPKIYSI